MSSQFPDIKNEMDQISVPVEKLDAIIAETVIGPKKKKPRKRILMYSMSAAMVGFGLFIGSAMVSPAMAKVASNIPVVGTFFNDVGDEGLKIAGQKGLTQIVDQTVKDNGITLTINEVFYDGTRLTFGYTQESLLPLGELERPVIKADGKEINFSSGYSGEYVTPQKYKGIVDITPSEELPEEFEMTFQIDAVGLVPGKWSFQFPVKQSNKVKVIRMSDVRKMKDAELRINKMTIGPAGTVLNVGVVSGSKKVNPYSLSFYLIDDKGKALNMISASGSGETIDGKEHATLQQLSEPLEEGVRMVKVIPYDMEPSQETIEEESVNLGDIHLPLRISKGATSEITIYDIQYKEDRTIVYYGNGSELSYDDTENRFWLEESNGHKLGPLGEGLGESISGKRFKQEFAATKKEELVLKAYRTEMPIFEIKIPQ